MENDDADYQSNPQASPASATHGQRPSPSVPPSPSVATKTVKRRKKPKRGIVLAGVALVIVGVAIYWFMHRGEQSTDDAVIEAEVVPMAPKVGGYVVALHVSDNSRVAAGDVIAEIDPRDYQLALDKANADLASAEARVAGAGHSLTSTRISAPLNVTSAQAQLDAAAADWDRAKKELARLQKLKSGVISRQEFDTAVAAEKQARSNFADAQAKLQSAKVAPQTVASAAAGVKELEAGVLVARAAVAQAEKNMADTKIVAPIAGRVSERNIQLGNYVVPGQQLLSLVSDQMWVVANYKETQLRDMKPGQKAVIRIDAYSKQKYSAHVDSIQLGTGARFSAFPPENATGNFVKIVQRVPVKLVFDEKPDAAMAVGPGMSVEPTVYTR